MKSTSIRRSQKVALLASFVSIAFLVFVGWNAVYSDQSVVFSRTATSTGQALSEQTGPKPTVPPAMHVPTPAAVKAVYMSQCAAGTPSFREDLMRLIDTTELNSIVIDIRDYTGKIAFPTDNPDLRDYVSDQCGAKDMRAFVQTLHDKNMYVIGRITVFQNPAYTKAHPEFAVQRKSGGVWKDNKGLSFVDVGAKPYWDTVVELSKESYALGFDELNFDYIRYPSDGPMSEADYTWSRGKDKPEALEEFFKYLHDALEPLGVATSADLFGMVTTNTDDLNIGQVLERALPYFDYISPMVYPSHYPKGFHGYTDVNANAYNIVNFSMSSAVRRTMATTTPVNSFVHTRIGTSTPAVYEKPAYSASKMRPWLQSFDYPVTYTPAMVQAQIKANTDAGLDSYMFWDPANKYRSLRQVLSSE
ncbi:MAG TPA: putative glycoside hydrolase [Candidatus Paceibacterota bacterium]